MNKDGLVMAQEVFKYAAPYPEEPVYHIFGEPE
jgi:hypothetical protein